MIRDLFLAVALFLLVEGAISAFRPAWIRAKMAELKQVPDRVFGFVGFLFILGGGALAVLSDGLVRIGGLAVVLEGTLYGFLPMVMKRVMDYATGASDRIVRVWGETALGIGGAGMVLFY